MKLSKLLNLSLTIFGLEFLTSTTMEPTTNEILFKPLGNPIPELSWATIRTKINITDMLKKQSNCVEQQLYWIENILEWAINLMEKKLEQRYHPRI